MQNACRPIIVLAAVITAATLGLPSEAQTPGGNQPTPATGMPAPSGPGGGPTEASMMTAMDVMSRAMAAAPVTGNPDHDFVAMMIPHHQGAVAMAQFELAHGTDPAMRKLAQDVVASQKKEIADMKAWQNAHPAQH